MLPIRNTATYVEDKRIRDTNSYSMHVTFTLIHAFKLGFPAYAWLTELGGGGGGRGFC